MILDAASFPPDVTWMEHEPQHLLRRPLMHHNMHDGPKAGRLVRFDVPKIQDVNDVYARSECDEFHPNRLTAVGLEGTGQKTIRQRQVGRGCHEGTQ